MLATNGADPAVPSTPGGWVGCIQRAVMPTRPACFPVRALSLFRSPAGRCCEGGGVMGSKAQKHEAFPHSPVPERLCVPHQAPKADLTPTGGAHRFYQRAPGGSSNPKYLPETLLRSPPSPKCHHQTQSAPWRWHSPGAEGVDAEAEKVRSHECRSWLGRSWMTRQVTGLPRPQFSNLKNGP